MPRAGQALRGRAKLGEKERKWGPPRRLQATDQRGPWGRAGWAREGRATDPQGGEWSPHMWEPSRQVPTAALDAQQRLTLRCL